AAENLARYPDPMGNSFRIRAADVLGVTPDHILCGNGSDDILTIVTRAFVEAGETLRIPYPSYILYRTLAQIQNARCEEVAFEADWSLSDEFTKPDDDLRLAILPNPNSPTGTVVPPERILQLAEQLPCPLLVDEAYADFAETNCMSLVDANPKIMVARTLSKSYGLAGLRFGYLVAQPQVIAQLIKVKDSYNCDTLSIAGAAAAIDDQIWLADNVAKIKASRKRLSEGLARLGFECIPSQANFIWCEHPKVDSETIYKKLKEQRVLVRYMDYPGWRKGLRISVGDDHQIDACLALLADMVPHG
ncbi:MAG: histidinol-phosphate aminotransferase family protein, partial [bacterium]|nr:histidinol-phosphate aminotransferase family protein [bacterium]